MSYRYFWEEDFRPGGIKPTKLTKREIAVIMKDDSGPIIKEANRLGVIVHRSGLSPTSRGYIARSNWLDTLRDETLAEEAFERRVNATIGFLRRTWSAFWTSRVVKSCRRRLVQLRERYKELWKKLAK